MTGFKRSAQEAIALSPIDGDISLGENTSDHGPTGHKRGFGHAPTFYVLLLSVISAVTGTALGDRISVTAWILLLATITGTLIVTHILRLKNEQLRNDLTALQAEYNALDRESREQFGDLSREFTSQMNVMRSELAQVCGLIADAGEKLMASFSSMESNLKQQQNLAFELTANHDDAGGTGFEGFVGKTSESMALFVDTTIDTSKIGMSLVEKMQDISEQVRMMQVTCPDSSDHELRETNGFVVVA